VPGRRRVDEEHPIGATLWNCRRENGLMGGGPLVATDRCCWTGVGYGDVRNLRVSITRPSRSQIVGCQGRFPILFSSSLMSSRARTIFWSTCINSASAIIRHAFLAPHRSLSSVPTIFRTAIVRRDLTLIARSKCDRLPRPRTRWSSPWQGRLRMRSAVLLALAGDPRRRTSQISRSFGTRRTRMCLQLVLPLRGSF
jgi:hypothetical protein